MNRAIANVALDLKVIENPKGVTMTPKDGLPHVQVFVSVPVTVFLLSGSKFRTLCNSSLSILSLS